MKHSNRHIGNIIVLLLLFTVSLLRAQDPVGEFLKTKGVDAGATSIYVLDLQSGEVLGQHNASRPVVPASVMKCVTTASLLETVGENWEYETHVFGTGPVRDGVLEGNILVEGSADPSLNSRNDKEGADFIREIIHVLREENVDTVRGRIIVDESRFAGAAVNPTWQTGDLAHAYGTGTHGFNFEDNASGGSSVRDPAGVFMTKLKGAMARNNIVLQESDGLSDKRQKLLVTHRSAPVQDIMRSCMMRSDNQYAEAMLRTFSSRQGHDGSVARGASSEMDFWKRRRLPMEGVRIVDGSGLSRDNRLTARFLAQILAKMASNPYYASFFPLAGQEGTLRKFAVGTRLEGYAAMKTGSMNGIQSYAGYLLNDDYEPTHVIVIMMNNLRDRAGARTAFAAMLEKMLFPQETEIPITDENENE